MTYEVKKLNRPLKRKIGIKKLKNKGEIFKKYMYVHTHMLLND